MSILKKHTIVFSRINLRFLLFLSLFFYSSVFAELFSWGFFEGVLKNTPYELNKLPVSLPSHNLLSTEEPVVLIHGNGIKMIVFKIKRKILQYSIVEELIIFTFDERDGGWYTRWTENDEHSAVWLFVEAAKGNSQNLHNLLLGQEVYGFVLAENNTAQWSGGAGQGLLQRSLAAISGMFAAGSGFFGAPGEI